MAATERITVYLTKQDKQRVYAAAKAKGEHASEWAKAKLIKALGPAREPQSGGD